MDKLLAIGANVSTPLGLAGVVVVVVLVVLRTLMRKGVLRQPSGQVSGQLLGRGINYVFILAVLAIVFAATAYVVDRMTASRPTAIRELSGTLRDSSGHLLRRTRLILAGANNTAVTNDMGWFSMELPQSFEGDSATLLVGDTEPMPAIRIRVRTGLDLVLAAATPAAGSPPAAAATHAPAGAVQQPAGRAGEPGPPPRTAPSVRDLVARSPLRAVDRQAMMAPGTWTRLSGQDVLLVYGRRQTDLARNASERIRNAGGVPDLRARPDGDPALNGTIIYQSWQEQAAGTVRQVLQEIVPLKTTLSTRASSSRAIVVYLPGTG